MKKLYALSFLFILLPFLLRGQDEFYNDGAIIKVEGGALLYVKGDFTHKGNSATLTIDDGGQLTLERESTSPLDGDGDLLIQNSAVVTNNGTIELQGDLENGGTYTYGSSGTRLTFFNGGGAVGYQNLTGSFDGTTSGFYNLKVDNGIIVGGVQVAGLDASNITGNDLAVEGNIEFVDGNIKMGSKTLYVKNTSPSAITGYSATKFVDVSGGGLLKREIPTTGWPQTLSYIYPIGTTSEKYTPAELTLRDNQNQVPNIAAKFVPQADIGDFYTWAYNIHPFQCPWGPQYLALNHMIEDFGYWEVIPDPNTPNSKTGWDYDIWVNADPSVMDMIDPDHGTPYVQLKLLKTNRANLTPLTDWYLNARADSSGDDCALYADWSQGLRALGLHSFSKFGAGGGGGTGLPIELLYLEAQGVDNQYILVEWATATETNNDGFEVQRSTDGVNFETIGWVDGNGNSNTEQYYSFNDYDVVPNVVYYYRLKQVDFDGTYEYTYIVSAMISSGNVFTISEFTPNPTENITALIIQTSIEKHLNVTIYNSIGQLVRSDDYEIMPGQRRIQYDITRLPSGTYHAIITADNEIYNRKLVITK